MLVSFLNWWCIDGSCCRIFVAGRWVEMLRKMLLCGELCLVFIFELIVWVILLCGSSFGGCLLWFGLVY